MELSVIFLVVFKCPVILVQIYENVSGFYNMQICANLWKLKTYANVRFCYEFQHDWFYNVVFFTDHCRSLTGRRGLCVHFSNFWEGYFGSNILKRGLVF